MTHSTNTVTGFHIFAYGTLQTGQPESALYKKQLISSEPARIRGKLYVLPEGYPVLEICPSQIVAPATSNPFADWESGINAKSPKSYSENPNHEWIEGELLTLPLDQSIFESIDAWEGFSLNKNSFYQRVITHAYDSQGQQIVCWTYVSLETPQFPIRPLDATRWNRPDSLKRQ